MTTVAPSDLDALRVEVATAAGVVPVGGRTHWEVGGPPPREAVEVRAPTGVLAYDPAELTVTVAAGTTVADLGAVLAEADQECVLDPRHPQRATVGGTVAAGLSGSRRLRHGPLRDRVLEVRFITADGRLVKGGGPTVKNVTGYDLPRLLVGSLGTIGVLTQVTLRCQPCPPAARWHATEADAFETRRRLFRPSCITWDGEETRVLLEGHPDDLDAEARTAGLGATTDGPRWPEGSQRARASAAPARLRDVEGALRGIAGLRWLAEVGVGTVHLAADDAAVLARARGALAALGGWVLREAGSLDGYDRPLPNAALMRRVKDGFDPTGKLSPGRLPL